MSEEQGKTGREEEGSRADHGQIETAVVGYDVHAEDADAVEALIDSAVGGQAPPASPGLYARFIGFSLIGIILFFVPLDIAGRSSLLLDHVASFLQTQARPLVVCVALLFMLYGALVPWLKGDRPTGAAKWFLVLRGFGLLVGIMYLLGWGPAGLYQKDMLPFLFEKLVLNLTVIVPLGALALVFLIEFGLLELIGVLMQPIMRPVWRTPGKSAIDAVASFAGSYSVGLLITERMYLEKHYSLRDAAIIATGFSTVSAPFMVVIAKTLGLMPVWNLYFWTTLLVTFVVSAITAYLPPLAGMPSDSRPEPALPPGQNRLQAAWQAGKTQVAATPPLLTALRISFVDGLRMTSAILPSILAVGLLGLVAAKYTPLFDVIGLLFYPVARLLGLDPSMPVAGAMASGLAEMFLPVVLLKGSSELVRYVAAVVSVSNVLFLSASIPCMLATRIPLRMRDLLIVWFLRCVLSMIGAALLGKFLLQMGWLTLPG